MSDKFPEYFKDATIEVEESKRDLNKELINFLVIVRFLGR